MSQESLTPESVPRANGMPMLGIGTWQNEDPDQCEESVRTALETGYRHVDTAQAYGNEAAVGDGIAAADVSREDVFLATKVWIDRLDHDGVVESTEESLEKLGVDTLDLLYVHWPSRTYDPEKTLPALESLKDRGLIDRIAVSNFEPHHIDEAREVLDGPIFANQVEMHAVGDGIAAADVPREDVFLATKVWIDHLDHDGVIESTEESLEKLGVDTLDLLYVHWPSRTYDAEETLPALESLKDRGLLDRIGVSNFEPHHIDEAREILDGPIFANQVEMHPLLQQAELREYAAEADIELVAYSPLIRGRVFDVPELTAVAEKHGVSEAQVSLAWLREKGVTAIPKATSEAHIRDNWESAALTLDDEDVATIDAIDETDRRIDPGFGPDAWA